MQEIKSEESEQLNKRKLGIRGGEWYFSVVISVKTQSTKDVIVTTSLSAFSPTVPTQYAGTRASETTTQHFERSFF